MAQRRILAAPHRNNPPSMDSKLTEHPKPTSSTSNSTRGSDLVGSSNKASSSSSLVNDLSRLTLSQKARVSKRPINHSQPQPPPRLSDTRLQAKAMSVSAIVDSSKFSLSKPNPQKAQNNGTATQPVKENTKTNKSAKQMHNKECSRRELERQKLQGSGLIAKKDVERVVLLVDRRSTDCEKDEAAKMEGGLDGKRSSVSSIAVIGGRRRSVCGSQVELRDFLATHGVKVISADMPPFMQIHAVDCARKTYDSMEKFTSKTLALALKKEFDGVYGPAWHCIVGTSFGSFVTHSVGGFMYFSMDHKLYILLFKTTVQRAD